MLYQLNNPATFMMAFAAERGDDGSTRRWIFGDNLSYGRLEMHSGTERVIVQHEMHFC